MIGEISANVFSGTQAHSGNNYAWSNGLDDLSISSPGSFDFNSMWARGGPDFDLTMTAHGFNGVTEIYTQSFVVSENYQQYNFNFTGITSVNITNGVGNILIDDIVVNMSPVPEPETYAMLLAGLGFLGAATRRRKQKAKAV